MFDPVLEMRDGRAVMPQGPGSGGIVIFQDPPAGTRIGGGATITVQGSGRST